jgi:hypothetical protein
MTNFLYLSELFGEQLRLKEIAAKEASASKTELVKDSNLKQVKVAC